MPTETLNNWLDLARKSQAPLLDLCKQYEDVVTETARSQGEALSSVFAEAQKSQETLLGANTVSEALSAQRGIYTAWLELMQQQSQTFAQHATEAANALGQAHQEAGSQALGLLNEAADQLTSDTGEAIEQFLTQAESALTWLLKVAAQPQAN